MIDQKDITVVVQGAVEKFNTELTLRSVRKILPESKIILSTWENSDIHDLDYDELVINVDPGSFDCDMVANSIQNNINRQIVSTFNGIKKAKTKYVLKLRSDMTLSSRNFINIFQKEYGRNSRYVFFKNMIVALTVYSRNPNLKVNEFSMPYCVSDFVYFGYRSDLLQLFNIELIRNNNELYYFYLHPDKVKELKYKQALCRFMPEQYIFIAWAKKIMEDLKCNHRDDINHSNIRLTNSLISNNFILVDKNKFSVNSMKYDLFFKGKPENCFTENDWKLIYYSYAKNNYFIRLIYEFKCMLINNSKKLAKRRNNYKRPVYLNELNFNNIQNCVISVDIFDTLLLRRISPNYVPTSKTELYGTLLLLSRGINTSIEQFRNLRTKYVNQYITKSIIDGYDPEYLLDSVVLSIVNKLTSSRNNVFFKDLIVENEVLREIDVLYVNEYILSLLKRLKKEGKKIIAVSDMYLKRADILRILSKFDLIDIFDEVYVSSDTRYMKFTGNMFKFLFLKNNLLPLDVVHIGDNKHSDYLVPKQLGVTSYLYKDLNILKKYKDTSDLYLHDKYSFIRELLVQGKTQSKKDFSFFIQNYFAYDLINFVYTIIIDIYVNKLSKVYFLERDGSIFLDIWLKLFKNVTLLKELGLKNLKRCKISRKDSSLLIDIHSPYDVVERANKVNPPDVFSISHILGCFGIELTERFFQKDILELVLKNDSSKAFFFNNFNEVFLPLLLERRKIVLKNLTDIGLFEKDFAIVDIGWGGTTQTDIQTFITDNNLKIKCKGYYYGTDSRIYSLPSSSFYGYQRGEDLYYGYSLIEFIVKYYVNDSNLNLKDTYELNKLSRDTILDAVSLYSEIANKYCLTPDDFAYFTKPNCIKFIKNPSLDFVKMIQGVKFSLDKSISDKYIYLCPKLIKRKDYKKLYQTAQYIQGALVLSGFRNLK